MVCVYSKSTRMTNFQRKIGQVKSCFELELYTKHEKKCTYILYSNGDVEHCSNGTTTNISHKKCFFERSYVSQIYMHISFVFVLYLLLCDGAKEEFLRSQILLSHNCVLRHSITLYFNWDHYKCVYLLDDVRREVINLRIT